MSSVNTLNPTSYTREVPQQLRDLQDKYRNNTPVNAATKDVTSLSVQVIQKSTSQLRTQAEEKVDTEVQKETTRIGNKEKTQSRYTRNGTIESSSKRESTQNTRKTVLGKVNGKEVFSDVEQNVQQAATSNQQTNVAEEGSATQEVTRTVEKTGARVRVDTHIDGASQARRNVETESASRTDTRVQVRKYDRQGNVASDTSSRQAVTAYRNASSLQTRQTQGSRDVSQETTRSAGREGNANVQRIRTESSDTSRARTTLGTDAQTRTKTIVEKLDDAGTVLSARAQTQQVNSREDRTIDTERQVNALQTLNTRVGPTDSESVSSTRSDASTTVVDQARTTGTVQTFNGNDELVATRNFNRDVTTIATEDRQAERQLKTEVTKVDGATRSITDLNAQENVERTTRTTVAVDGAITETNVDARSAVHTRGELTNEVGADGTRTVALDVEETRASQTQALTVGPKGDAREVDTETNAAVAVQGTLQYTPAAPVSPADKARTDGVNVEINAVGGVRANFRIDNGALVFDLSIERSAKYQEQVASGRAVNGDEGQVAVAGPRTNQQTSSDASVRLQGRVFSTVDEAGNRIITVSANVTGEGTAVQNVQGQVQQAETAQTNLEVNGQLQIARSTTANGTQTTTEVSTRSDVQVNRVDERERIGQNVSAPTLSRADGVQVGFSTLNGTGIKFDFGSFNLRINYVA